MAWDDSPLSEQQREVAGIEVQKAVVLAGPGTGKTWTLVRRIEYLIDEEAIQPSDILAVTFTRAAAAEMKDRIVDRLGDEIGNAITVSTLHAYALSRLLSYEVQSIPMPVRIADDWEERQVVIEELKNLLGRTVKEITEAVNRLGDDWNTLRADDQGWESSDTDAEFLAAFRRHRAVYGYTLRNELPYRFLCELRQNPEFLLDDELKVVVVDEYQDLNKCDLLAIDKVCEPFGRSVVRLW